MLLTAVNILITIIAVLLAAAVLLLIAVLFAPLSYEAGGEYNEKPDFNLSITWLFGLVKIKGHLGDEGLETKITYPFKRLKERLDKKSLKTKKSKSDKNRKSKSVQSETKSDQKDMPKEKPKKKPKETAQTKTKPTAEKKPEKSKNSDRDEEKSDSGLIGTIASISAVENKGDILSCLVKNILYLLKKQKIKTFRLKALFGFDDPSLTGKVLGLLYTLTVPLKKDVDITPDFDKAVFEADTDIKGRGNLFYIAVTAVKILLNKNVRNVIFKEV
ncbi:MAG: DUF2953 domain-containing protein [Clostridiales bacterium]|nr:DUF2953 domain-containing protein [Clostridiales bacterium]